MNVSLAVLKQTLQAFELCDILSNDETDIDQYLFLLMTHVIEPELAKRDMPVAVIDFPVSQAALAQTRGEVAERFEVYFKGIELLNGFHELTEANIQAARFESDNQQRIQQGREPQAIDTRFLAAMTHGLPQTTGVALGVDRLFSIAECHDAIQAGLAFDVSRA